MIIRAEYIVTVRCDARLGNHSAPTGLAFKKWEGQQPEATFTGETRALAIRAARANGWLVGSSRTVANRAYCPDCREHAPKNWRLGIDKATRRG